MSEVTKLLPCPFCGEMEDYLKPTLDMQGFNRFVTCEHCGLKGQSARLDEFAIVNWNSRPAEEALQEQVQVLREALNNVRDYIEFAESHIADPEYTNYKMVTRIKYLTQKALAATDKESE